MTKRSTTTNLVVYSNYINENLRNQKQIDAIHTDMSAVFDKVAHKILLQKLNGLDVIENALKWIESFLVVKQ